MKSSCTGMEQKNQGGKAAKIFTRRRLSIEILTFLPSLFMVKVFFSRKRLTTRKSYLCDISVEMVCCQDITKDRP